jgi:hypothetical protein
MLFPSGDPRGKPLSTACGTGHPGATSRQTLSRQSSIAPVWLPDRVVNRSQAGLGRRSDSFLAVSSIKPTQHVYREKA